MTAITLTWNANNVFEPHSEQYSSQADWIYQLIWRNRNRTLLPSGAGLYIIENPQVSPVYAGSSDNIRSRFDARTNALRELGLRADAVVPNHRVRLATVNPSAQLDLAEQWLVRILFKRDQNNNQHILQNINLTAQFNAPNDGLTITNSGARPDFLNAAYQYAANAAI